MLDRLLTKHEEQILTEEQIVVQNLGMHHWLSLEMAGQRGIAMNLRFPLVGNYIWRTIRTLSGEEQVPQISPFSSEILTWVIYDALNDKRILQDPLCHETSNYWRSSSNGRDDPLKRFQLSQQLASQFEQYLIYRPEWIREWDQKNSPIWQARLWRIIGEKFPEHPLKILERAISLLPENYHLLPKRTFFFGLNSLPPIWISFLDKLAQYRKIHLFVLNPSAEYWGDIQTEKTETKRHLQWLEKGLNLNDLILSKGNPLLANLGQQGREFINQLNTAEIDDISLFYTPGRNTLLHCLQDDLLTLQDARKKAGKSVDDTLVITSAHSILREVQSLHDWLLHIFEKSPQLTPKDVLVMCPQVDKYAPYVDAIFSRTGEQIDGKHPQIPCSVADCKLSTSEPVLQAFLELLELPDSRFQVSQILSYLRLTAVQRRFALVESDVDNFSLWLSRATIHWGLDSVHKSKLISLDETHTATTNDRFTWAQGLRRLLLGFAYASEEAIFKGTDQTEQLLIPWVDESQAINLGKLLLLLERLQYYIKEFSRSKTAPEWRVCLLQLLEELFLMEQEEKRGEKLITESINSLVKSCELAVYKGKLSMLVVRNFLKQQLSQAGQGYHFMTGQVTFCSLLPMRSVPFQVIAILGLNEGEFPRQTQKPGFDLMEKEPPKFGDRSKRGDDRTLFLEALISARQYLYLSYQGQDVKNNNPRQPSLLLRELMDYLEQGYFWSRNNIRFMPLQPFSKRNFSSPHYGYDNRWLSLDSRVEMRKNLIELPPLELMDEPTPLKKLVDFFVAPAKVFARTRLLLNLDQIDDISEDSEPFTTNYLDRYQVQELLINALVKGKEIDPLLSIQLRNNLPDTPQIEIELKAWREEAEEFAARIRVEKTHETEDKLVKTKLGRITLNTSLTLYQHNDGKQQLFWRLANPKGKDLVQMWLHHLVANLSEEIPVITRGIFRDAKKEHFKILEISPFSDSRDELVKWVDTWQKNICKPTLLNADLALKYFAQIGYNKPFTEGDFYKIWQPGFNYPGLGSDPYIGWFWPEIPNWHKLQTPLVALYQNMFSQIREVEE